MNAHAPSKPGYTARIAPDTIRIERLLPGPAERVWSYLMDSAKRGQWLAAGQIEPHVGGRVEHIFRNSELTTNDDPAPEQFKNHAGEHLLEGVVTAYEPNRALAYSWGESGSEVRFDLEPKGDKVLLTVTHSRVVKHDMMLSVSAGWHTHLDILLARMEGREPEGFWRKVSRLKGEYETLLG